MINYTDYIVFDFETSGLSNITDHAVSLAGKAYNARSLQAYPVEQGGEFASFMKPPDIEKIDFKSRAFQVNHITREQLEVAPDQSVVWNQFIQWVGKFNPKGTQWMAPIACGKNIRNFDMGFVEQLNLRHSPKKDKTVLFNKRTIVDLEDLMFTWFENESDPPKHNMDELRGYFGLSKDGAHSAVVDVQQTGALIMKFLSLHRVIQKKQIVKFKGAFASVSVGGI